MNLLSDIFKELPLSSQLMTKVGGAEVHKIKVNKQERKMGIDMKLKNSVSELDVIELKSKILENFPLIDDLDININYIFENMDIKSKIEICWDNIVYLVESQSPVCGSMLKAARWEVTDGTLFINIMKSGSFVMARKGIDKLIQSFLNERLDEGLSVRFTDTNDVKRRDGEELIKQMAMETAQITVNQSRLSSQDTNSSNQNGFKRFSSDDSGKFASFKGSSGGRKGIKIIKTVSRADIQKLSDELIKGDEILIEGRIFSLERKETKSGRFLFIFDIYDRTNSITVKMFIKQKEFTDEAKELLKVGKTIVIRGTVQFDEFSNEINIMGNEIGEGVEIDERSDDAEVKRVELHLHTQMSSMDGVTPVKDYIKRAIKWGHKAVAITDHGVVQAFPEAMELTDKKDIKVIYGVEAYLVDDLAPETCDLSNAEKIKLKYYHAIILVKNYTGLRNLYELISISHLEHFYKRPRIFKSDLTRLRDGLIIGTACEAGEFYKAILEKQPDSRIEELANFYDYFEIQPTGNNMYLYRNGTVKTISELEDINKQIFELGEKYGKPVVATCDVHFINPEDEVYRRIIMAGDGFKDADDQAPLFFRTTDEMLKEFQYLGSANAYKAVVSNTNLIADLIEKIKPIPDGTYAPKIDGAEEELRRITMEKVADVYGENLPDVIKERLDKELTSIIKNGFAVMYIIAQKLVWNSVDNGYLVGSRGSVGSSFVATMAGITEVNPLQPHYICRKCRYSDFDSDIVKSFSGGSGCDLPDKDCPVCGAPLAKDGHDIPFETFLGFDGDKEPDIDLNFSGEYQLKAHAYTEELFGTGNVFKAGTIGTLADKTAFGYVRKYMDERNINVRNAEVKRLVNGCTGIKKTTGQHPGGLMIVPNNHSIYEFCPVQRPANDTSSNVITTHFDYHSISGRLLKLDLLGHDVPTIIRMLHDFTGVDPRDVPLDDPKVMSLFNSCRELGVTEDEIGCETGSLGLPEFGTDFVRQMLLDTMPSSFSDLVRISGLSHGTDVWLGNAQELIRNGDTTIKGIIACRDDIMIYLINMGVPKKASFKIMENVRKGKGLTPEEEELMEAADVPDWYIESCKKIKYLFPKGHAVAYVLMTVRIAYFKLYHPYAFYAATLSVKAEDFDYELMCKGKSVVIDAINKINAMGKDASAKDKNTLTALKLVLEMYARGLQFVKMDIYKANASKFMLTDSGLMAPICSIQGLGVNVAQKIVETRDEGEFITIDDFRERTKTNKTVIEILKNNGILDGIPDTSQLSLF